MNWYYHDNENANGPYTTPEFRTLIAKGIINRTTDIRRSDMNTWVKAAALKGVFPNEPPTPPPAPPPIVNTQTTSANNADVGQLSNRTGLAIWTAAKTRMRAAFRYKKSLAALSSLLLIAYLSKWAYDSYQVAFIPPVELPPGLVEDAILWAKFNPNAIGFDFLPADETRGATLLVIAPDSPLSDASIELGDKIVAINGKTLRGDSYFALLREMVEAFEDDNLLTIQKPSGQIEMLYKVPIQCFTYEFYVPEILDAEFGLPSWYLVPEHLVELFLMIGEDRQVGARAKIEDLKLAFGTADPPLQLAEAWVFGKEMDVTNSNSVRQAASEFSNTTRGQETLRLLKSASEIDPGLAPLAADIAIQTALEDWQNLDWSSGWGSATLTWLWKARETDEAAMARWVLVFDEECESGGRTAEAAMIGFDIAACMVVGKLEFEALKSQRSEHLANFGFRVEIERILAMLQSPGSQEDKKLAIADLYRLLSKGTPGVDPNNLRAASVPPFVVATIRQGLRFLDDDMVIETRSNRGNNATINTRTVAEYRQVYERTWKKIATGRGRKDHTRVKTLASSTISSNHLNSSTTVPSDDFPKKTTERASQSKRTLDLDVSLEQLMQKVEEKFSDIEDTPFVLMTRDSVRKMRLEWKALQNDAMSPSERHKRDRNLRALAEQFTATQFYDETYEEPDLDALIESINSNWLSMGNRYGADTASDFLKQFYREKAAIEKLKTGSAERRRRAHAFEEKAVQFIDGMLPIGPIVK